MTSVRTSLLAVLVIFSGSILAQMELTDNNQDKEHSGGCRTTLPIAQTSQRQLGPSKSERSPLEESCTAAVVDNHEYKQYIEMSARGRHTAVNMTSAGLQDYAMYFAVRGYWLHLQLSPTSPVDDDDLYYRIIINGKGGGYIFMLEHFSRDSERVIQDVHHTTNIDSRDHYTFYYLSISDDTLNVGRRGEPPLMTHTSTELKRLRYFSFKRALYSAGEVLYDCAAE